MFTRVAPQKAVDSTAGFTVQVADRYHVEYIDASLTASIEVDFGPVTGLYPDTLSATSHHGTQRVLARSEQSDILERIEAGLSVLGVKYESCPGRP